MSYRAIANQAKYLGRSFLKRLLINQCFFWSNNGEAKVKAYVLQTKTIKRAIILVKKNCYLDVANINFGTIILSLPKNAKK